MSRLGVNLLSKLLRIIGLAVFPSVLFSGGTSARIRPKEVSFVGLSVRAISALSGSTLLYLMTMSLALSGVSASLAALSLRFG